MTFRPQQRDYYSITLLSVCQLLFFGFFRFFICQFSTSFFCIPASFLFVFFRLFFSNLFSRFLRLVYIITFPILLSTTFFIFYLFSSLLFFLFLLCSHLAPSIIYFCPPRNGDSSASSGRHCWSIAAAGQARATRSNCLLHRGHPGPGRRQWCRQGLTRPQSSTPACAHWEC